MCRRFINISVVGLIIISGDSRILQVIEVFVSFFFQRLVSGKRLRNYGKSQFLMGKSTISMAMFNSTNSKLFVYQRVSH